jgi:hypothetical protein
MKKIILMACIVLFVAMVGLVHPAHADSDRPDSKGREPACATCPP